MYEGLVMIQAPYARDQGLRISTTADEMLYPENGSVLSDVLLFTLRSARDR